MARTRAYQSNFTGGELSPRLFGWIDLERYGNGAAALENVIVLPHGGVYRRAGTVFVDGLPGGFRRLIAFEFAVVQSYMLAFGPGTIGFYANRGIVIDGRDFANGGFDAGIAGWTDTSAGTGTVVHDNLNGRLDLVGAGAGNEARAEQSFPAVSTEQYTITLDVFGGDVAVKVGTSSGALDIANATATVGAGRTVNFQSAVSRTLFITFENANNDTRQIDNVALSSPAYRIDAPYTEGDLDLLQSVQESSTLYLVHPDWAPRTLTRDAVNEWVLSVLEFQDGPYLDFDPENPPATTLTPSAASGAGVTLSASDTADINGGVGFATSDVGRLVRLDNALAPAVNWGWAIIVGFTDATHVTIDIQRAFTGTAATDRWRLGAWSETTGYPRAVGFFEQRIVYGNSDEQPDVFWMSETERLQSFAPSDADGTVNDDNAITYRILSDNQNAIDWLAAAETLAVGTRTGEYIINSGTRTVPVVPSNILVKRQTNWGSNRFIRPALIGGQILFVQRAGRRLREFVFDFDVGRYIAPDVTIVSEHITRGQIFDMAYQQEPDSVLWASRGDGVLAGLTYEREQERLAWHRHILGGLFQGGNAVVESIATIPTPDNDANELWLTAVRTIDGQTVRTLEYMAQPWNRDNGDTIADAYFVDCGLSYDGPPAQFFAGLDHLEGETVQILADGAVHPDVTVTGGQVELVRPASRVHVGLGYVSRVAGLPLPGQGAGLIGRIDHIWLRFHETLGARYGRPDQAEPLTPIPFRSGGDPMDAPPPVFSGWKKVAFNGRNERDRQWMAVQDLPLPFTLLAVSSALSEGQG